MSGMPSPSPSRINGGDRDKDSMWYFSSDDLATSPSRKAGISPDQELSYRQMTAYLIQEMGQRLQVSQLCINTAIVYMHRFYAFHSFTHFHRNGIAAASLFLAAKVEEQPRKLEHVIKAANKCLTQPTTSTTDTYYLEQAQDLVFNENVLLQTLGFDVAIDHPHTHVVKTCHLVKACKDLAQTSYFLASNSLHLTSMCLQYKPTVVACFCIYLACKWSRWEIPQSTEGKHWFHYVDETVTMDLLKKLTDEFIAIYEKSPARLKSKLNSIKALAQGASNRQGQVKDKKADQDWKVSDMMNMKMYHPAEIAPTSSSNNGNQNELQQQSGGITQPMLPPPPHPQTQQMRKTELHTSSQHRSHHSSSSSSATSSSSSTHHPPKLGYTPGDVPDHKLSKQQQQQPPYGSSSTLVSNRPPREHTTSTSQHPTAMLAPSSNPSTKSSSRSAMSNSLTGQPSLRHSSTQGHAMDVNYKSRDRGLTAPPPPTAAHSLPPHGMQHKLSQKQDGGSRSMSSKDHTGRLPAEQQSKLSSSNSNKVFSTSSSSQYGSNSNNQTQLTTGSTSGSNQASVKLENLHDMSRNMIHNTRGGYNNPPPPLPTQATTTATAPLLNFHQQQQQGSRHSNNNSNSSSSSSLKLEQSKQQQISVHMQQQQQTSAHQHHQHHQKQPLITATDPTTYPGLTGATHDLQQPPPHASLISNNYSKIEPLQHSEDPHHPNVTQYNSQAQNQVAKAANTLFSPDWSDKLHAEQIQQPPPQLTSASGGYNNNGTNMTQNTDIYAANFNIKKESPPKIKTERDTPSKKDKNRSSTNSQQDNGRSSGHNTQNMLKTTITKKLDTSLTNTSSILGLNELAGTSSVGGAGGSSNIVGGVKRPNEQPTIKTEDDLLIRDSKIRKLDGTTDIGKHQVVNGIETNPDLVRNLLKESLLPITSLLKTETSIITPSLEPPAELFEPSATTSSSSSSLAQPHNTSITLSSSLSNNNNNNVLSGNSDISAMETDDHANTVSKSEKKKKKDKHKHKEKDKSKDREERKKHKKDKDRHKDKERDSADNNTSEHVKIKISKEKLESAGEPIGFKIKIPKERLMGDLSGVNTSHAHHNDSQAPPVLKIKISKDKLESYSSGSADMVTNMTASTHSAYAGHTQSTSGYAGSTTHTSSSSSSSSNKKKDRDREKDRERDKDKKRSHDSASSSSVSKSSNGGAGGSSLTASAAINNTTATNGSIPGSHSTFSGNGAATTQKTQNSSKIHHQSNMSLLFGESNESNDDDDDDYNDDY